MGAKKIEIYDRMTLLGLIYKNSTPDEAVQRLKKNYSSIYREIIAHLKEKIVKRTCYYCSKQKACQDRDIKTARSNLLYQEHDCFEPLKCRRLHRWPFCCNGCDANHHCFSTKYYYDYMFADKTSREIRRNSRRYTKLSNENLHLVDEIVHGGIHKGQSLHHLYLANRELSDLCSEQTIRRLVYRGYLRIKCFDLRRYTAFKHETQYVYEDRTTHRSEVLAGRTFRDYEEYVRKHKRANTVQLDSIIGKLDDAQALLTITFPKWNFQFGHLYPRSSPVTIVHFFNGLREKMGNAAFTRVFGVVLADNGIEFYRLSEIESDENGEVFTHVFYTNPYRSTDKAECERNHEFVRYVIPKGKSLDGLNQTQVDALFSHINAYFRKSKNEKTPFDLANRAFGSGFMKLIGISRVPAKDVCLNASLLTK